MIHNIFAAGTARNPRAANIHTINHARATTIIGRSRTYTDDLLEKISRKNYQTFSNGHLIRKNP
ncbi:uncharacterized protein F4807DRAFT_178946 [Annulohypoxylon truncatum]|uniref:uncharacterized protein n=1 Tax=Annulohypoxylon truncatum TaxID=327061 RepID=UPI002007CCA8|nr:uncharacterized protein F4807DRAFT_178946 [Annulohypoxylon truncatum]KAI1207465.1 hypothetical protein F4807DRAFT_178946 [Annulohypoxylon truncatum]